MYLFTFHFFVLIFHIFNNYRTVRQNIKEGMIAELPEIKQLYEDNKKIRIIQQRENIEDKT